MKIFFCMLVAFAINLPTACSQATSSAIPYTEIYTQCLDANVVAASKIVETLTAESLNEKDKFFVDEFKARFGSETDVSTFLEKRKSPIDELLKCYRDYWRISLLNPAINFDSVLTESLTQILQKENLINKNEKHIHEDTLDFYLKKHLKRYAYNTTGYSKTGRLLDLLVWKSESDSVFNFSVRGEKIESRVIFMDDFVTLGWEEYATIDRYFPAGWATKEALYCVKKAYNLKSERFLISYLCHEARHFSDYKEFPKLESADLEYRAKLTELSMLNTELYNTINFFINNANESSQNGHSVANYFVIRDLSRALFQIEFEKDINKWKLVSEKKIQDASYKLFKSDTKKNKAKA